MNVLGKLKHENFVRLQGNLEMRVDDVFHASINQIIISNFLITDFDYILFPKSFATSNQ